MNTDWKMIYLGLAVAVLAVSIMLGRRERSPRLRVLERATTWVGLASIPVFALLVGYLRL